MEWEPDSDPVIDLKANDAAARAAYRRRRVLTAGLGAVAVLAVIGAGGLMVGSMRATGGHTQPPPGTAAAPPTTPQYTSTLEQTLEVTTPPATTPTTTAPAVVPPQPAPTTAHTPPPPLPPPTPTGELKVSGPTTAVLMQSDGTIYRGQFTVTITNAGPPYTVTFVRVFLPTGVHIDFAAGNPGFATCVTQFQPGWWGCTGPSIPSGGTVTNTVHLTADNAPLSGPVEIHGFTLQYNQAVDMTPDDNVVSARLVLLPVA